MKEVYTAKAPTPVGAYSQATIHGNMVYLSGQIAIDPADGSLRADAEVSVQAELVLSNLSAVLEEAGSSLDKVLKVGIFLTDMEDFHQVNKVYASYFKNTKPARFCVAVSALPKGVKVEMDATAYI